MSTLFVAVNAGPLKMQKPKATPKKKKQEKLGGAKHDTSRHLCRHEWLELLVRVAVARYILSRPDGLAKPESDVSNAVRPTPPQPLLPYPTTHHPPEPPTLTARPSSLLAAHPHHY